MDKPKNFDDALKRNSNIFPGAEHKGYVAGMCTETTWTDRYGSGENYPVFKLSITTPLTPDMSDKEIDTRLKEDLGGFFPDIGLISHREASKRIASENLYIPYACKKVVNWTYGIVRIEMLLEDEFKGFQFAQYYSSHPDVLAARGMGEEIDTSVDDALPDEDPEEEDPDAYEDADADEGAEISIDGFLNSVSGEGIDPYEEEYEDPEEEEDPDQNEEPAENSLNGFDFQ
jgi:hypothetical protein